MRLSSVFHLYLPRPTPATETRPASSVSRCREERDVVPFIECAPQMRRRLLYHHLERRSHMCFDEVTTPRGAVALRNRHMNVKAGVAVGRDGNVADAGHDLELLR